MINNTFLNVKGRESVRAAVKSASLCSLIVDVNVIIIVYYPVGLLHPPQSGIRISDIQEANRVLESYFNGSRAG